MDLRLVVSHSGVGSPTHPHGQPYTLRYLLRACGCHRVAASQRKGRIGAEAVGTVYEMLNDDKRNAIAVIVEERAGERDPEHADDITPP